MGTSNAIVDQTVLAKWQNSSQMVYGLLDIIGKSKYHIPLPLPVPTPTIKNNENTMHR